MTMVMSRILLTGLLSLFHLTAFAQAAAVTVSVSEPPYLYESNPDNTLASITITETAPDALQDGFISLLGVSNAEQELRFTAATTVTGSVSGHRFDVTPSRGFFVLIIEVDTDDSQIDTITINPVARLSYDSSWNRFAPVWLQLADGHPMLLDGTAPGPGTGIGSAAASYELGIFAGNGGIQIGTSDTLTLAPNETVTLPHNGGHPGLQIASLNPAVTSLDSFSATEVTITGQSLGQTRLHAWNPQGVTGLLYVNVVASAPPPVPPSPAPEPPTPELPPDPEPEDQPPAMSVLETTTIEGGDVNATISIGALPRGGNEYRTALSPNEVVSITAAMVPAPNQVGQFADLFIVVRVTTPGGYTAWFQQDATGLFIPWNEQLNALVPVQEGIRLSELERAPIYEGRLESGQYDIYFGYWADNSSLIYSRTPLQITVRSAP